LIPSAVDETEKNFVQLDRLFVGGTNLTKQDADYQIIKWQMRLINLLKNQSKKKPSFEDLEALQEEFTALDGPKTDLREKDVLEKLISPCREWLENYHALLRHSTENLERLHNSLEKDKGRMNVEDNETSEKAVIDAIDEVIARYNEYQAHKIRASEFEKLLAKAEKISVQFSNEVKFINDEITRTEKFRKSINISPKHLTVELLLNCISENDTYILHVPEMLELYRVLQAYKYFEIRFNDVLERIQGNAIYYSITDGPKGEKYKKVTIEEIQKLLKDAQQLPLYLDQKIAPINDSIQKIKTFRTTIQERLKACHSAQDYSALKAEALKTGVYLPEVDDLKRRVTLPYDL
jgi:hypothetical protein